MSWLKIAFSYILMGQRMRYIFALLFCLVTPVQAMELQDGHIHYNQVVWGLLPADQAVEFLVENGIARAIVSSTPAQGTERLYQLAPERIIPFLRPYRTLKDVQRWHADLEILAYIKDKAATGIYRGFGEFHMWIEHLPGSILPEVLQIAAKHQWALSAHTDIESIEALIRLQPTVVVIWAHCGFDYPANVVARLFEKYPTAYCELSLNEMITDEDDNLTPAWKELLEKHADRFMVGMDTNKNSRWGDLAEHADNAREWLLQLEPEAAALIARGNIARLFPPTPLAYIRK